MSRSLLRISPELTRISFSRRLRAFSKHFSTWRKQACVCSWQELQKHKFRLNKSSLHGSSRHLLQWDREKDEKKLDKPVINKIGNGSVNLCNQPSIDSSSDISLSPGPTRASEVAKGRTLSFPDLGHSSILQGVSKNSPADNDKTSESSPLTTEVVNSFLNTFFESKRVRKAAQEKGLTEELYGDVVSQFRMKILTQMKRQNRDMIRTLKTVYLNSDYMANLFPLFMAFAQQKYPMLRCMDEVKKISDLRGPADLYPEARTIKRKIIYHSGPTNSGKTHSAIERFKAAETGIYCGPLRLLATEVFQRTNDAGILCDLLTGEDRQWAISPDQPANHIASTIEMCSTRIHYDCAVIDEIQMMRDSDRGWAWTTALLGLPCQEIHVCGEDSALDLVQRLATSCGDEMEVHHYERLSPLKVCHESLGDLANVRPGDCIVAFSQRNLYQMRKDIERKSKKKCAIIYGGLPPATKVEQAAKFNDPSDECSVLVASDAIGMGLNLNIKRIVFSTMIKYDGTNMVQLTSSQAKQIAGRAGRFGTDHPEGEAMTLREEDTKVLQTLMSNPTEEVKTAGLAPSMEQIEMLSQELPDASLLKLYEVFESVVQLDGANYFMCDFDEKKKIAEKLQGIPLTIKEQYIFSNAPINIYKLVVVNLTVKFAESVSRDVPVTSTKLERFFKWPPKVPRSLDQLQSLEAVHEGLDLYLWLSYRFPEIFVDQDGICEMQQYVEVIIGDVVSSNSLGALRTTKPRYRFNDKRLIGWIKRDRF